MNLYEKLSGIRVARITFPFTNYLYNRKNILKNFNALQKSEWYPQEKLRSIQLTKLKKVIGHAYQHVPFFKDKFGGLGLLPRDIKTLEDLKKIPPLTRQDVIDFHEDMVDNHYKASITIANNVNRDPGQPMPFARFRKHKLIRNTSSGSTGAPTVFYDDGTRSAWDWVHEMRLKSWFGVRPGERECRMVRLSTDYMPHNRIIRMRRVLWNQLLLPGTNLSDQDYQFCIEKILRFRPQSLYGYPASLAGLAEYVSKTNGHLWAFQPRVAIGWSGPVYEHEEKIIRKTFNCPVSNNYGAREVGHIAGKCPHGTFHINQENMIVESEGDGGPGEILVTTLDRSPMPFIRFRMGDIGEVGGSDCTCGRKLQILKSLLGRTGEIFITKDGRMISPNFWCRFFFANEFSNAVRRFQIIYKKNKDLKIKIERDTGYSIEVEDFIKQGVNKNFSSDTNLELDYVPIIKPKISGKYQMVVNEAN